MKNKDNMNYDRYNWYFDRNNVTTNTTTTTTTGSTSSDKSPWTTTGSQCVGEMCCNSGSYYDASLNVCVVGSPTLASAPV